MKVNHFLAEGIIWVGILALPVTGQAQSVSEKVWEEPVANLEKVVEVEIPEKILKEVEAKPGDCFEAGQEQAGSFAAHQFERKGVRLIAVRGGGTCQCSPTGNCSFWVYRDLGGRYVRVLRSSMVQQFGFLKFRSSGLPDIVLWSHGSAMQSAVSL